MTIRSFKFSTNFLALFISKFPPQKKLMTSNFKGENDCVPKLFYVVHFSSVYKLRRLPNKGLEAKEEIGNQREYLEQSIKNYVSLT